MLGKKLRDIVTGFEGIATARCEYINGCVQYRIEASMKSDGTTSEKWIDHNQLEIMGEGISIQKKNIGGPAVNMPKGNSHP